MTWDALRKSINGLVNKINAANIKHILPEVFSEVGECWKLCGCCLLSGRLVGAGLVLGAWLMLLW
jgi:pre-mRNA-splicing factor CWC22